MKGAFRVYCRAAAVAIVLAAAGAPASLAQGLRPFERARAERLLRDRLPCLGCHRLDGEGGIIGPDLTAVAGRRSADFIRRMVSDPQATVPGTVMPLTPMPEAWRELVVAYLTSGERGTGSGSLALGRDTMGLAGVDDPAVLYARACAACHGARGHGDGPNAANLPVKPTVHADSAYMSTRPDDTLFDGIYGGGYILNRGHRMPAFGQTLSREQIWGLVRYLRELCRCEGPEWSTDGDDGRRRR